MIYSEDSLFVKSNEKPITQVFIPDILNQESIIETSDYVFDEDFNKSRELDKIIDFIILLRSSENRDVALKELNNKRDKIPNLAGLLWYSSGTVAILLQEIINVYPFLTPSYLTQGISERICNVLGLFQCISLDSQTRKLFIISNLPLYL